MTLPTELQGEGTYDYKCRDMDCEYCKAMGLTPAPEIYFEPAEFIIQVYEPPPIVERRKYKTWTGEEITLLRHLEIDKLKLTRSMNAIAIQFTRLRKKGLINCFSAKSLVD